MPKGVLSQTQALEKRVLSFYKTWSLLDMDKMAPFYSKEPDLLVFNDVEPVKFDSWKDFAEAETNIMQRFSWWKSTPKDLRVSVWGSMALTTSTPTLTGQSKTGKNQSLTLRHTAVWRKEGKQWLIMHDHWSIPWPLS